MQGYTTQTPERRVGPALMERLQEQFLWEPFIDVIGNLPNADAPTSANHRIIQSFLAPKAGNIEAFRIGCRSIGGTGGTWRIDLHDFTVATKTLNGASLQNGSATPAAGSNLITLGAVEAVAAGDPMCIVLRNTDGTPGTNFGIPAIHQGQTFPGWIRRRSTDGTNYYMDRRNPLVMTIVYDDGEEFGFPATNFGFGTTCNHAIYDEREIGLEFTFKRDILIHDFTHIFEPIGNLATAGDIVMRAYDADLNQIAISDARDGSEAGFVLGAENPHIFDFSGDVTTTPGGLLAYRGDVLTLAMGQSVQTEGDSSNYWQAFGVTAAGATDGQPFSVRPVSRTSLASSFSDHAVFPWVTMCYSIPGRLGLNG